MQQILLPILFISIPNNAVKDNTASWQLLETIYKTPAGLEAQATQADHL